MKKQRLELESQILHAKFQGHKIFGSGEEDFLRFLSCGHLGHVNWSIYINFCSPFPRRSHMNFGLDWPGGFRDL